MTDSSILDSREDIAKLDKSNVLASVEALGRQVQHAWDDTREINAQLKKKPENIVIAGMGGSGLGAHVIKALYKDELNIPFDFVNSYNLPKYVSGKSLVILASYSGNTEEILSCASQASDSGAEVMVICAGGELAKTADTFNYPYYLIDPEHNPSNQPRMAIGYAVFGTLALLDKAGLINLKEEEIEAVISTINKVLEENKVEIGKETNLAKQLAFHHFQYRPVFICSEHMEGSLHVSTNQHNENAKIFADYKVLPEINHHLLEGLKYPDSVSQTHAFTFIESDLYREENQRRMDLSRQVAEQHGISTLVVKLQSKTKLEQVFESITLFALSGFYLSMLEGIDPAPIPTVDWFKKQLAS